MTLRLGWTTLFAAGLALLWPNEARADGCDGRPGALLADLGLHVIAAGYQHRLDCELVVSASAGLYAPWTVDRDIWGLGGGDRPPAADIRGFMGRGRFFVFPWADAPRGPWLSPYVQAGWASGTVDGASKSGGAFAAGLSAGYTFALADRWLLGLGLGGQYHLVSLDHQTRYPGFLRFGPTVDILLGYAL